MNKFQVGDLVRVLATHVDDPASARSAVFAFRTFAPYSSVGLVLGLGQSLDHCVFDDGTTYVTVLVNGERLNFMPDELTKVGENNEL